MQNRTGEPAKSQVLSLFTQIMDVARKMFTKNDLLLTDPIIAELSLLPEDAPSMRETCLSLVDVSPRIWLDTRPEFLQEFGYPLDFRLRETVSHKLIQTAALLPKGINLLIKEALRPAEYQAFIFERRKQKLSSSYTELSMNDIVHLTAQFIAPPEVAGHPTGGAFDLTLCDDKGQELDLGCAYDEDATQSVGRCYSDATNISTDAARYRKLMFAALQEQGFVNYPFEWWHWSYGDRYWAVVTGCSSALYGPYEYCSIGTPGAIF